MTADNLPSRGYTEVFFDNLTLNELGELIPPGSIVTRGEESTPYGTTASGKGAYVNPDEKFLHIEDINGVKGKEDDWPLSEIKPMN